jgi:hypothetical protein
MMARSAVMERQDKQPMLEGEGNIFINNSKNIGSILTVWRGVLDTILCDKVCQ